jgi:hypothetical protein
MSTRTSMQLRNLYSICPCKLLCCCYKRSTSPCRPPSSANAAWSTPLIEQRQDSGIDLSVLVSLSQNSQEISTHLEVLHECLVIMLGVSRSRSRAQYNNSGPLALMLSLALLLSLVAFVLPAVISASASDLPAAATQNDEEPTVTRKLLQSANSEVHTWDQESRMILSCTKWSGCCCCSNNLPRCCKSVKTKVVEECAWVVHYSIQAH